MTVLVSREAWRAHGATHDIEPVKRVDGLAVHHSGSQSDEHQSHLQCTQTVQGIQAFHQTQKGWSDIAYTFVACRHDVLFQGRALTQRPASQGTDAGNDHWLSVCVLGHGGEGFRGRSLGALRAVLFARALVVHAYPSARQVRPHSAFHVTACPGDDVREWLASRSWLS